MYNTCIITTRAKSGRVASVFIKYHLEAENWAVLPMQAQCRLKNYNTVLKPRRCILQLNTHVPCYITATLIHYV